MSIFMVWQVNRYRISRMVYCQQQIDNWTELFWGPSITADLFLTCHLNPILKPCNNRYLNKHHTQTGASHGITIR